MDKVVQKLVAMGIPGLILLGIAAAMPYAGAVALTAALAAMGGPFGLIGGVVAIGVLALVVDAISEYGFEAIGKRVVEGLKEDGLSRSEIIAKVNGYSMLSKSLKKKILEVV